MLLVVAPLALFADARIAAGRACCLAALALWRAAALQERERLRRARPADASTVVRQLSAWLVRRRRGPVVSEQARKRGREYATGVQDGAYATLDEVIDRLAETLRLLPPAPGDPAVPDRHAGTASPARVRCPPRAPRRTRPRSARTGSAAARFPPRRRPRPGSRRRPLPDSRSGRTGSAAARFPPRRRRPRPGSRRRPLPDSRSGRTGSAAARFPRCPRRRTPSRCTGPAAVRSPPGPRRPTPSRCTGPAAVRSRPYRRRPAPNGRTSRTSRAAAPRPGPPTPAPSPPAPPEAGLRARLGPPRPAATAPRPPPTSPRPRTRTAPGPGPRGAAETPAA